MLKRVSIKNTTLPAIKNKTDDWNFFTIDIQTYTQYNCR